MIKAQSWFVQQTLSAIMFVLVLGALSMIWPGIMAVFLVFLLLIQACCIEQEIVALGWTEIDHLSMVFTSLRRPGLPAFLS